MQQFVQFRETKAFISDKIISHDCIGGETCHFSIELGNQLTARESPVFTKKSFCGVAHEENFNVMLAIYSAHAASVCAYLEPEKWG
jgi:hypothetical protein